MTYLQNNLLSLGYYIPECCTDAYFVKQIGFAYITISLDLSKVNIIDFGVSVFSKIEYIENVLDIILAFDTLKSDLAVLKNVG